MKHLRKKQKRTKKNSWALQTERKELELCMDHYLVNLWEPWC